MTLIVAQNRRVRQNPAPDPLEPTTPTPHCGGGGRVKTWDVLHADAKT
jgi:hypothetical protein